MKSQTHSDWKESHPPSVWISGTPNGAQLPQISHLDTGSLVNLFQKYSSAEYATTTELANVAKDFAWPAVARTSSMYVETDDVKSVPVTIARKAVPVRNDSTGSSSIASSGRSSLAPTITRHSSCSSVEEKSPTPPPKDDKQSQVTALPKYDGKVVVAAGAGPVKRPSRTSTMDSATSSIFDKPLPAQPKSCRVNISKAISASTPATPITDWQACLPMRTVSRTSPPMHRRSVTINLTTHATAATELRPRLRMRSHSATTVAELPASLPSLAPQPLTPRRAKALSTENRFQITARTAENVIYRIMSQLERAEDLRSAALVSKGFLNTFQRNESKLVSKLMFRSSRAAWETRRSIIVLKNGRDFTLCDYQRDIRTLRALKTSILANCISQCRPRTLSGLSSNDKHAEIEVDNALWRLWTFCALFGENAAIDSVPSMQLDWLNGSNGANSKAMGAGFGVGNGAGLSIQQMEDLIEIWECFKTLMARFHGRHAEALKAGVLDEWNPSDGTPEDVCVGEWTSYLLTLGPQVILALSSASFEKAKYLGLTKWTLPATGTTRSTFLNAAISKVYQQRLLAAAAARPEQMPLPKQSRHRPSRSVDETRPQDAMRRYALRIDTQAAVRRPLSTSFPRVILPEIVPDCDTSKPTNGHLRQVSNPIFPASATADPSFFHTLSMNRAVSTRLGATLFPVDYPQPTRPKVPFLPNTPPRLTPPACQVVDPIDKALHLLVQQMGFHEANAKRALAMTDTGSGVNVERAIDLLSIDSNTPRALNTVPIELPTPSDLVAPLRIVTTTPKPLQNAITGEDRCDGTCPSRRAHPPPVQYRRNISRSHTRSRSLGHWAQPSHAQGQDNSATPTRNSSEAPTPISPITDIYGGHSARSNSVSSIEWRRDSPMTHSHSAKPTGGSLTRQQSKAWRVLGVGGQQRSNEVEPDVDKPLPGLGLGLGMSMGGRGGSGSKTTGKASRSNVVGMDEYLARIERRRSQRVVQEGWRAHARVQAAANRGVHVTDGVVERRQERGVGDDVFASPSPISASTTASPGALGTVYTGGSNGGPGGSNGGLGGFRPVVAVEAGRKMKSPPPRKRSEEGKAEREGKEGVEMGGSGSGSGGKVWRSVVGTIKGSGHYKSSKRERQVAREMCVGGGERAFVG